MNDSLEVTFINAAAQNLLGLSERQAVGRRLAEIVKPGRAIVDLCARALKSRTTIGLREVPVFVSGQEINLDCRAVPLEADSGLLLEIVDTERERTFRREAELLAQQKVSRQMMRQLAHEVKNPLGGMRGAAQLLERKLPEAGLKRYTQLIIDEADRLAALVNGVLNARGVAKPRNVSVHRITEHVANLIQAEIPDGMDLVRDYDPSLPPVHVDRDQMIQAFLNLARNALQAVGDRGRIVIRTRALPNFTIGGIQHRLVVSAEIEDSGPGIPDEIKETVFYPLVTGRRSGGAGIGLTVAQDLVSGNGGLIEFTSRPGRTVFQVRIPASDGRAPGGGGD